MEIIKEMLQSVVQSTIGKIVIMGIAAASVGIGFVTMNLNGQNTICHDDGFGDYNDELGACEVKGRFASNIVIVAGNTANTPKPEFDVKSNTYKYIKNSIAKNANIKVISVASGLAVTPLNETYNAANDATGYIESINAAMKDLNEKISQVPKGDGATYLEAISKAGRDAMSAKAFADNTNTNDDGAAVIVIGSGLSDGGVLNFADNNLLSKEVDDIINEMERTRQLSSRLDGLKIFWYGIGQTMSPQEELCDAENQKLREIYEEVFRERGAVISFDDTSMPSAAINGNNYTVKPTSVSEVIILDNTELVFSANQSILANENMAKQVLEDKGVFKKAKANPGRKIIITGYMAAGNCSGETDTTLAGQRAETVRDFLKRNGVTNEIEVVNGGVFEAEKSECVNDVWNSELADYRRKTVIEFE